METNKEVLDAAHGAGFTPTPKQQKDWRREGLLPKPVNRDGFGRSVGGSVVYYPPGTGTLLTAICRHSQPKKPMRDVALLVWWDGFALPNPDIIPSVLVRALDDWERLASPWANLGAVSSDSWAELDRLLQPRLPVPLRSCAKLAGGDEPFRQIVATLLNVASGGFDGFRPQPSGDVEDARSDMSAALSADQALWITGDLTDLFSDLSAIIQPAVLRKVLTDATATDLEQARDEVRDIVGLIDNIFHLAARLGRSETFALFEHLDMRFLTPGMLSGFTLFWLSASRKPSLRRNYQRLRPAIETVSTLRKLLETPVATDTNKLPRRLEPSGSTAQGDKFPCMTILASPSRPFVRETAS